MIGTLRTTSDSVGTYTTNRVYTAFGEEITSNSDRYGYAGDWGYQSHSEFSYQHVGARYYDPSTGRFLQRDPIGIRAGTNVYAYVANNPLSRVDPSGHGWLDDIKNVVEAIWEAVKAVISPVDPSPHAAGAAGCMMEDALRRHIVRDHPDDPSPKPKTCPTCRRLTPKR